MSNLTAKSPCTMYIKWAGIRLRVCFAQNTTDLLRVSCDTRWQRAADPVDGRFSVELISLLCNMIQVCGRFLPMAGGGTQTWPLVTGGELSIGCLGHILWASNWLFVTSCELPIGFFGHMWAANWLFGSHHASCQSAVWVTSEVALITGEGQHCHHGGDEGKVGLP